MSTVKSGESQWNRLSPENGPFHVGIYDKNNELMVVIKQANFVTPKRDKLARELALAVRDERDDFVEDWRDKARQVLKLYEEKNS